MFTIAVAFLLLANTQARAQQVTPRHYELDVSVDYRAEQVRGTARITVENIGGEPVTEIPFTLYRLMSVSSVRCEKGTALNYSQDVLQDPDFAKQQLNEVRVTLAEPLLPGARTSLEIAYAGYLLGYAETGMAYVRERISPAFTILRDDARSQQK